MLEINCNVRPTLVARINDATNAELTLHSRGPVSAEYLRLERGGRGLVQFAAGFGHEDGGGRLEANVGQVLPDQTHDLVI